VIAGSVGRKKAIEIVRTAEYRGIKIRNKPREIPAKKAAGKPEKEKPEKKKKPEKKDK
jgi:hypothetical protein